MNRLKNKNGVTLIALVITIVVLLILVGVTLNVVLNPEGIIQRTQEAKYSTNKAVYKEELETSLVDVLLENMGEKKSINELKEKLEERLEKWDFTVNEEKIIAKVAEYEFEVNDDYKVTEKEVTTSIAYTRGQEVTIGTETFYILEDSDETNQKVKLFAKYNLNTAGTAQQPNANYGDTKCNFNLAVSKAKSYTSTVFEKNAEGRLLTSEEATILYDTIETDSTNKIAEMLWGQANAQEYGNFLYYWLSSLGEHDYPMSVSGYDQQIGELIFYGENRIGVRPVIEVLKSEIYSD